VTELGYDPDFLRVTVAPPLSGNDRNEDPSTAEPDERLAYTHFTVRMHPTRRLAWWVAWNIDGLTLFPSESISRSGERFKIDDRIPADSQTGEQAYDANDLDRGHIARRSDLLWGSTLTEAKNANSDSFYFTNITPQRSGFNQSGRGGVWGLLENAVLALDGLEERRLSLFAGPVLAADDPPYRDIVQLPREHWKIVIYRLDGRVKFKTFLLTQNLDGIEPLRPEAFLDDFDTYLVPLQMLEERTGLTFTSLSTTGSPAELQPTPPQLVINPEDVGW
jgi:endonuclease G